MDQYERYYQDVQARLKPARAKALELLRARDIGAAEKAIEDVEDSIYGSVALRQVFTEFLNELKAQGALDQDPGFAAEVFMHAERHAWRSYPEPHTEYEADSYRRGYDQDRAELVRILGRDPGKKG